MLISYISAGNAFFRGKRRHGVRSRQVHCNQLVRRFGKVLFNKAFFFTYGNSGPVTYAFVFSRKRVVHCRFSAVGIAGESNSHYVSSYLKIDYK